MFNQAARLKLRFSYKGQCSVEDLWDLTVIELDAIYKGLNAKKKSQSEESLLGLKSKEDDILELKISIIKYIVETKLLEQQAREDKQIKADYKKKLLSIKAEKQDAALHDLSAEELNKMLDDLD
jgi:hypothetical protein